MIRARPRFRLVETTADMGLLVWGETHKDLFENAAAGLFNLIASPREVRPAVRRSVVARGIDSPGLLVAWLSEWLYLFDARGFLGGRFQVEEIGGGRVKGCGWGETYRPGRHALRTEVKGITYHGLEIRRTGGRLRARLVVDV